MLYCTGATSHPAETQEPAPAPAQTKEVGRQQQQGGRQRNRRDIPGIDR